LGPHLIQVLLNAMTFLQADSTWLYWLAAAALFDIMKWKR
jgi:hypothetical protein